MPTINSKQRQELLKRLLTAGPPVTQKELVEQLQQQGLQATQSTISRDLQTLNAVKIMGHDGQAGYSLNSTSTHPLHSLIKNIIHNEQLIVITTTSGSANLIAARLDAMNIAQVLGTIAGDNTIFIALTNSQCIPEIIEIIKKTF